MIKLRDRLNYQNSNTILLINIQKRLGITNYTFKNVFVDSDELIADSINRNYHCEINDRHITDFTMKINTFCNGSNFFLYVSCTLLFSGRLIYY